MHGRVVALLFLSALVVAIAQHQEQQQQYRPYDHQAQRPLPAILMHKQSLTQDGSFNYAFAADNGLQQGETISPDGTRRGAYTYVDPNGKKITVKYTAGKDGFRVEGDHLPKAPAPVAAAPAPAHVPAPVVQSGFVPRPSPYQGASANSVYRSNPYYKVQEDSAYKSVYQATAPATFPGVEQRRPKPIIAQQSTQYSSGAYNPDDKGIQEPHSFGSGYSFEFAG
ncbi:hypothetical protein C0J52_14812 [Blattella germanica]|nr:hypothetical protein C0J52_14812 [Blattella germanica]